MILPRKESNVVDLKTEEFSKTAHSFWILFISTKTSPVPSSFTQDLSDLDKIRHQALLGFTAIEAALAAHWQTEILPHWAEFLCLVSAIKNSKDSQILDSKKKSKAFESLSFIKGTTQPSRFSPSLGDYGLIWSFLHSESSSLRPAHQEFSELLLVGQMIRNSIFHVGRGLSQTEANQALEIIENISKCASKLHPIFAEVFKKANGLEANHLEAA
jgi:hypothetical protein